MTSLGIQTVLFNNIQKCAILTYMIAPLSFTCITALPLCSFYHFILLQIRLKEIYETPTQILLVLELVTGGELFERFVQLNSAI